MEQVEHLAFEALEVIEGDVQKVAAAAGGVEHPQLAQLAVEAAHLFDGLLALALLLVGQRGHLHLAPLGPQGLDDGGQHQPLDVGARGVVGAELVALAGVEGALEQGAEDGRLHIPPVGPGGLEEQLELVAVEGDGAAVGKQAAVEAQHLVFEDGREAAGVHALPQALEHGGEVGGLAVQALEQLGEAALGEQADVFGEHGEQRPHEKAGDVLGAVPAGFKRFGEGRQLVGDLAGDPGGFAGGVEAHRVEPQGAQALANVGATQVIQPDAEVPGVGEGGVVAAGAAELGVELDVAADVDHHDEGRPPLVGGQGAHVLVGLLVGGDHRAVPARGVEGLAALLGLEHKGAAAVEVDVAVAGAAVGLAHHHPALKYIGVVAAVARGRVGRGQAQQRAQLGEEELVIGPLTAPGLAPALKKGVDPAVCCVCHVAATDDEKAAS